MKKIFSLVLILMVLFSYSHGSAENSMEHYYVRLGMVTALDYENDIVTVVDSVGLLWQFYGIEDWWYNDFCGMLMYDNDTIETIFDDVIIQTIYCGYLECWTK